MFQFQFKDRLLTRDQLAADADFQAASAAAMAVGFDPDNPSKVHVFPSETDFVSWSRNTQHGSDIANAVASMSMIREQGEAERDHIMASYNENSQRAEHEMEALARQMNQPWPSEAVFRKGHELGIIHSGFLWDGYEYSGAFRWLNGPPIPDFRWIGFDDVTSSVWVAGVVALYDGYWFSGVAWWFDLVFGIPSLGNVGFDDMASSGWATGP